MKLEVKNVKYLASLSEETLCFTATIYADGKKFATASNRGHGGETEIHSTDGDHYWNSPELDKVREWVKTLPEIVTDWGSYAQSLESLVDDLVVDWLTTRELKSKLKKKWLFTVKGEDGVYSIKRLASDTNAGILSTLIKHHGKGGYTLLNTLPLDDAAKLYKGKA